MMIGARDIVCISSIDWDFALWQGHQEIMATLAARGTRVLFIENTGVRPPRFGDLGRIRHRIANWRRGIRGFREERPNLFVFSPLVLPFPYSRLARRLNRALLAPALRRWMRAVGFGRPVVWTFLPTPLARDLIRDLDASLVVYYCIDDLASSSPGARRITGSEDDLLREADLVFVTSGKLQERAARFNRNVRFFPFGVSYGKFEAAWNADDPPADMVGISGPVAGYVGGLHQWIDQPLLAAAAERLPHVTFVLVGALQTDVSTLTRLPNVRLLGPRPHDALPGYIKAFDVGLVPYRIAPYTANVYPTKLNEYLAMGIPVVTTDLEEIRRFNAEHGDVVDVATDAESFAKAVQQAVETSAPAEIARRREVAQQNSWERRIPRMVDAIDEALAARRQTASWDDRLRRVYRVARRRVALPVLAIVALWLVLSYTPLVWMLAAPLQMAAPARAADAIVVFAGGVGESGKAGGGYQERVKHAVALYQSGYAPRLIFSSGFVFAFREAEVMKSLAVSLGVPAADIVLEERAANTYENVLFVRAILEREGWRSVLLVSSPYHMRRAVGTFRKSGSGVTVIPTPVPVPDSSFYAHSLGASVEQTTALATEYGALGYYWWKGRL